jgi:hypothetical protein
MSEARNGFLEKKPTAGLDTPRYLPWTRIQAAVFR